MEPRELIHRYLDGTASDADVRELNKVLAEDESVRKQWIHLASVDSALREVALERVVEANESEGRQVQHVRFAGVWRLAALLVVGAVCFAAYQWYDRRSVATLVSTEDAAWVSALPTTPGSALSRGTMELKAGMATIRFHSGVETVLEAPARLELLTAMRGRLDAGTAVVDVPEPAVGFIMEMPNGYLVDHGTQFAVSVNPATTEASLEVLSGEISVHHSGSKNTVTLRNDEVTLLTEKGLEAGRRHRHRAARKGAMDRHRFRSQERVVTLIRNDNRELLSDDTLEVRTSADEPAEDRRSLFQFRVPSADRQAAVSARIRFYVVQTGVGFAAHLPKRNRFAVYGITQEDRESFSVTDGWDASGPLDAALKLGTFEIPRSKQRGVVWFRSDKIIDYIKADTNGVSTFVLVRETGETERHGLVHGFATDAHPDGAGPVLELTFGQQTLVFHEPIGNYEALNP